MMFFRSLIATLACFVIPILMTGCASLPDDTETVDWDAIPKPEEMSASSDSVHFSALPKLGLLPENGGRKSLRFSVDNGSRKAYVDGIQVWLGEPAKVLDDGKSQVSFGDRKSSVLPLTGARTNAIVSDRALRVVLDPGHGGQDPGAISKDGKTHENELAFDIARKVQFYLKLAGCDVKMTRKDASEFVPLEKRPAIAKSWADLFVSIHINSADSKAALGIETYAQPSVGMASTTQTIPSDVDSAVVRNINQAYPGNDNDEGNVQLAFCVQRRVIRSSGLSDRGVRRARFKVLREATVPAALVECGYISNNSDCEFLKTADGRERIARGIYQGIVDFAVGRIATGFTPAKVAWPAKVDADSSTSPTFSQNVLPISEMASHPTATLSSRTKREKSIRRRKEALIAREAAKAAKLKAAEEAKAVKEKARKDREALEAAEKARVQEERLAREAAEEAAEAEERQRKLDAKAAKLKSAEEAKAAKEKARKDQEALEAAEKARIQEERLAREAAEEAAEAEERQRKLDAKAAKLKAAEEAKAVKEKARKDREALEAAEKARVQEERLAREAAEEAAEAEERQRKLDAKAAKLKAAEEAKAAKEKARKDQEALEAAEKARIQEERLAREAAEEAAEAEERQRKLDAKAVKLKAAEEAKAAKEKARKDQEALEAAEKARIQEERLAREAAEEAAEAEERQRKLDAKAAKLKAAEEAKAAKEKARKDQEALEAKELSATALDGKRNAMIEPKKSNKTEGSSLRLLENHEMEMMNNMPPPPAAVLDIPPPVPSPVLRMMEYVDKNCIDISLSEENENSSYELPPLPEPIHIKYPENGGVAKPGYE